MCTPGFAPVPAVKGGAVEVLITYLIEGNEINNEYDIDLYTIGDEAFPMVSLEAMAMKKCIISSNSGGLVEPIDSKCVIIVEKNNLEEELYEAMKKNSLDNKLSSELSEKAFNKVYNEKKYNKENYLKELVKINGE